MAAEPLRFRAGKTSGQLVAVGDLIAAGFETDDLAVLALIKRARFVK